MARMPPGPTRRIPPWLTFLGLLLAAGGPAGCIVLPDVHLPSIEQRRSMDVAWEGYGDALEGEISYRFGERGGWLSIALPDLEKECFGSYETASENRGEWMVSCPNGVTASGSVEGLGQGRGAEGLGTDSRGGHVRFRVGGSGRD